MRGRTPLAEALHRSVAVVGSRFASPYGVNTATELGRGLAEHGLTVVSGAAYGIEAAAHRGALAGNGRSVALLGSGIDVASPPSHESLFARICDTGLLVSEWPPGCSGIRRRFALANRLIASAGRGVVMVEGTVHSQALMTLAHAHRLGRRAMAIPGPVTSPVSAGCHHALRDHIGVRLVTDAVQVVQEINAAVLAPRLTMGRQAPDSGAATGANPATTKPAHDSTGSGVPPSDRSQDRKEAKWTQETLASLGQPPMGTANLAPTRQLLGRPQQHSPTM